MPVFVLSSSPLPLPFFFSSSFLLLQSLQHPLGARASSLVFQVPSCVRRDRSSAQSARRAQQSARGSVRSDARRHGMMQRRTASSVCTKAPGQGPTVAETRNVERGTWNVERGTTMAAVLWDLLVLFSGFCLGASHPCLFVEEERPNRTRSPLTKQPKWTRKGARECQGGYRYWHCRPPSSFLHTCIYGIAVNVLLYVLN